MSTTTARKLLEDAFNNWATSASNPALHDIAKALFQMTKTLDEMESKIDKLTKQVTDLQRR